MPIRYKHSLPALLLAASVTLLPLATCRADEKPTEEQALVHVYHLLTLASHDYEGHRKTAMTAVRAACDAMRLDPEGDHRNEPGQRDSDDLMHEADKELQDVLKVAQHRNQPSVVNNVSTALHEVHMALHIK